MVRRRARRFLATVCGVVAAAYGSAPASAACRDVPTAAKAGGSRRPVTPRDLIALRDVGYPDPLLGGGPSPLAVSPDGRLVAFVLNQADPDTNAYCRALVVVGTRPGSAPAIVDRAGELITITDVQRGMFVKGGFPALVTPAWSPDGSSIAYLKRVAGSTQVWRVDVSGATATQVTRLPTDVEAVGWTANGRIIFATRPALVTIARAIEREGRSGWLYDDRVVTFSGPKPQIRAADAPLEYFTIGASGGVPISATPAEVARLGPVGTAGLAGGLAAISSGGKRAWVVRHGLTSDSDSDLFAGVDQSGSVRCNAETCHAGIIGVWWSTDGREVRYLRRQGWNKGDTALYRWTPGAGAPRLVFATRDALVGCVPAVADLVCTRENATTPRRLVRIDPLTGQSDLLFDANPEFDHIGLGRVVRLEWRNDRGLETWGDLVLPTDYRPGQRVPLVVVQYSSRGFLRGGTGDEYPIYALAARGIAVLSLERPPFVASLDPTIKDWTAFAAANQRAWAERRSLLSAIETGVRLAIARGIADPQRIGITGLSDGATTARFALINSRLFSAASISSCCLEPWTVNTAVGIAYADFIQSVGYPSLIKPDADFWRPMSLAQNAAHMDTPLLMQLNDDDGYSMALEAFETLREYRKPVEMYVFPGEFHAKWQPAHKLAIYQRNLDWFDFWLRGEEDPDPSKAEQYKRWRAMRDRTGRPPVSAAR